MRAKGDNTGTNVSNTISEFHKSCDRCGLKKRKCNGGSPCRRIGETCIYSKRRRANRPETHGSVFVGSASDPSVHAPSTLQAERGVSASLQQYGRLSLKRLQ